MRRPKFRPSAPSALSLASVGPLEHGVKACDLEPHLSKILLDEGESAETAEAVSQAITRAINRSTRRALISERDLTKAKPAIGALRESFVMMATELLFAYTELQRSGFPLQAIRSDADRDRARPAPAI